MKPWDLLYKLKHVAEDEMRDCYEGGDNERGEFYESLREFFDAALDKIPENAP